MAATVLEELVTVLGFEIEDGDLKKFNLAAVGAFKTLRNIALVGGGAATGIGLFVNSVANATDGTFKFAKTVGASFAEVQKLTHATQIWGGTAEDTMSTLKGLASITSKATRGAGGGEIFGILGISPSDPETGGPKNTVELFKEIADNMHRMGDESRQLDLLGQLGISQNMILLLRQGSKGIEQIGDEVERYGFVLSPEQGKVAESFVDSMIRANMAIKGLKTEIGLRLAPTLEELIGKMLKWRETNRKLIDSKIVPWVDMLAKSFKPLAIFMGVVLIAMVVMAAIAFAGQVAFLALAGAVAIALADYHDFVNGVDSTVTERAIKKLEKFRDVLKEFRKSDLAGYLSDINVYHPFNSASEMLNRYNRNSNRDDMLNPSKTTISPTYNIRSTDPVGIIGEIETTVNDMWVQGIMVS